MASSFIVLSEVPIDTPDATTALQYLGLDPAQEEESIRVRAIVPQDTQRSLIAEVIDQLGLLDLQGAWEAITHRHRHEPREAKAEAATVLAALESAFTRLGCEVAGELGEDDPLPLVRQALETCESQTVVVFSDPQLLEETFAQDWAHKVEDELGATVLHLYPGRPGIGTA